MKKIDPIGINNVNFSFELSKDDDRRELFKKQRLERGFDDTELWNLDITIARFIYPRLKAYVDLHKEMYSNLDSFNKESEKELDKMVKAFKTYLDGDSKAFLTKKEEKTVSKGFRLFIKHFRHLWT